MNREVAQYLLARLKYRYLTLRLIEIFFISISSALASFSVAGLFSIGSAYKISFATACTIVTIAVTVIQFKIHCLRTAFLTSYLNQQFPQLNESADLLISDESQLSSLQLIQKQKTLLLLSQLLPEVKLPHHIVRSIIILFCCIGFYLVLSSQVSREQKSFLHSKEIRPDKNPSSIFVKSLSITVSPPSYTHISSFEPRDLNLSVAEGSDVTWTAMFSSQPEDVKIFFSGMDSVGLSHKDTSEYSLHKNVSESGFYQLQWKDQNKTYHSDYYKIEIIEDQAPKISVKGLDQFTKLKYTDHLNIRVESELTDDYGLTNAQLVATVSKGSGEGVKFREEKLRFDYPEKIEGKKLKAIRTLDLKKLGLEPSDELYFYIEATDNKTPSSNLNRTETYFIAIQDTSREVTTVDSGLGVDLMPEYFRSQRQIIIDTEKLLRDKRKIPVLQFNSTSNELGYDQKVLRLRYGQFLGEEDEAGIGQHVEDNESAEEGDPSKKFGHQHDTKNEHNLVAQKNEKHNHDSETKNDDEKEDPIKEFVHQHDNTEQATFFIQTLKTKLKAAITQMWDAELYLRLYQPEKSLPYQYRALNLLKEISNDSRIFVHRSGFDPPPLKEDKRLTADLSDVKPRSDVQKIKQVEKLSAIRSALTAIEKMISENSITISRKDQKLFYKAGQELSNLAIEKPIPFLRGLSLLKFLADNSSNVNENNLNDLRAILSKALPSEPSSPAQQQTSAHALNKMFLETLDLTKHD